MLEQISGEQWTPDHSWQWCLIKIQVFLHPSSQIPASPVPGSTVLWNSFSGFSESQHHFLLFLEKDQHAVFFIEWNLIFNFCTTQVSSSWCITNGLIPPRAGNVTGGIKHDKVMLTSEDRGKSQLVETESHVLGDVWPWCCPFCASSTYPSK